jgi:hypothetical protein
VTVTNLLLAVADRGFWMGYSAGMRPGFNALLVTLSLTAALVSTSFGVPSRPASAQSSLPPLPAGWPSTLQLGMADGLGDAAAGVRATAPFGFRYQYLAGGAPGGWATWNPNGSFVTNYAKESFDNGLIPVFTYYQMRQSAPNGSQDDANADYNNLQNQTTMAAVYNDLKLFFQRAGGFPGQTIVLHVEPDFWGFMQQRASGDDAATVPAQVASTGVADVAGLPNSLTGFAQAIVRMRNTYAPNVVLGYHLSIWGTGNDIVYSRPDDQTVANLATRSANFYTSLQTPFDITFGEFSDRDAAFKQYVYGDGGASWWNAADFSRNELYIGRFVSLTRKRVVFWQIPGGNTRMLAQNNTWEHYQDNKVEWLLDDPGRANLNAYLQAGVVGFLFGRGADGATCYCDAARDGVTNPPPINGNTRASLNADDDGGFFRERAAAYYAAGAMPLPTGGGPSATNTPTSTPTTTLTSTPTRTSTPSPTTTPVTGTQTVTFDDLSSPNRVLDGQYPSGLIDWGTNAWYLSGPYGSFRTNSVGFNGAGPTSASFAFVTPQQVVQLDAYNGGTVASTVSLSCAGQTTRSMNLASHQLATIATGWTGTCNAVGLGSSNGWDTNFDDLVVGSTGSGATSTPTLTATPTRTPTPVTASQTLTFDDLSNPNRTLNGQYPSGVVDWGTNAWYLSGPWGQFATNSIGFNGPGLTSGSFTFISPKRLLRVDAYNGASTSSTVTLACSGQPTVNATVGAHQVVTISTNWTSTCSGVLVTSSNGWDTNFDNVTIQ